MTLSLVLSVWMARTPAKAIWPGNFSLCGGAIHLKRSTSSMPIANNKSRVECSGADRCTFADPRTALFCHPRCKPSQRHKTAQKIASIYAGCYGVTGVTAFFEFVKTGEMATATSEVVTNGPQVVPNSLEVVPNDTEVV